jgi:hypothetical protein
MRFAGTKFALAIAALALCATPHPVISQERIIALKGGDTFEVYSVWYVKNCKSVLADAPTVELLEGPPQVKMWVEPAMVVASRLKCTVPVTGGKLMAKIDTIEQKADVRVTFRVVYPTTEGIQYVARVYNVSLFRGEATPRKTEPSRSWSDFLASVEPPTRNDASRLAPASSSGKSRSARKIIKRHKLTRVASLDQAPPSTVSKEALYAYCRQRVYRKYAWNGHNGKIYLYYNQEYQLIEYCLANHGKTY